MLHSRVFSCMCTLDATLKIFSYTCALDPGFQDFFFALAHALDAMSHLHLHTSSCVGSSLALAHTWCYGLGSLLALTHALDATFFDILLPLRALDTTFQDLLLHLRPLDATHLKRRNPKQETKWKIWNTRKEVMSKMKDWNPVRVPLPFVSTLPSGSLMCVTSLFRCNSSMSFNNCFLLVQRLHSIHYFFHFISSLPFHRHSLPVKSSIPFVTSSFRSNSQMKRKEEVSNGMEDLKRKSDSNERNARVAPTRGRVGMKGRK